MALLLLAWLACTDGGPPGGDSTPALSPDELRDPAACAECHPDHYQEWSGGMHAYASVDPLVEAMSALGERETGDPQAASCAPCHAPMAEPLGLLDGADGLAELPEEASGVTCFWCHSASVSDDLVLRGGIHDPMPTGAHESQWSSLHDRSEYSSVSLCGSCHLGTLYEWQDTLFAEGESPLTCGGCHMDGRDGVAAAEDGAPERRVHNHSMPGLNLALVDFPEREAQRDGVLDGLDSSLLAELCVIPGDPVTVVQLTMENVSAGHRWSSSSRDRRAWVEMVARDEAGAVLASSGLVADDEPLSGLDDPDLWMIGLQMVDASGQPVYLPWRSTGFEGETLPPPDLSSSASHVYGSWLIEGPPPDRVSLRVRIRPVALDVGAILAESGDLDPQAAAAMPTLDLASTDLEWTADMGSDCVP